MVCVVMVGESVCPTRKSEDHDNMGRRCDERVCHDRVCHDMVCHERVCRKRVCRVSLTSGVFREGAS